MCYLTSVHFFYCVRRDAITGTIPEVQGLGAGAKRQACVSCQLRRGSESSEFYPSQIWGGRRSHRIQNESDNVWHLLRIPFSVGVQMVRRRQ